MKTNIRIGTLILIIGSGILPVGCEDIWNRCVDGNGNRISSARMLEPFSEIQVNGEFDVQIDTGWESSAVLEADENLMDLIVTHVSGNTLIIESRNHDCLRPSRPIEITVITPAVNEIQLNGSGYVNCYGLATDELNINLEGSGTMDCHDISASSVSLVLQGSGMINSSMNTENLTARLDGSGDIRLSGNSVNADLKLTGSGHIRCDELISDVCFAYISGSGRIDATVNNVLDVTIIGSGLVYYSGNPTVDSDISGSGKVIHK